MKHFVLGKGCMKQVTHYIIHVLNTVTLEEFR